jgi:Pup amidohydrolase
MDIVPKIIGYDSELANSLVSDEAFDGRNAEAARRLLQQFVGCPRRNSIYGTQSELGRRFLESNGGSVYIDCDHLEVNLPETLNAFSQPTAWHAMLRSVREAQLAASRGLPRGTRLCVLANTGDGGQQSYGSHVNVCISRRAFQDVLFRKPHLASVFATHLVTSLPFTGQGQVGAGNDREACTFQWSQRADWFEQFFSMQTTHQRGLLNLRDENLCGDRNDLARLHIIFVDNTLSPVATILKFGTCQLVLAMLEGGWLDSTLALDDPLESASGISRDLSLKQRWPTAIRGRALTSVEMQTALAERAGEFVASGAARGCVPEAERIVELWLETLSYLRQHDDEALAERCDGWLKYVLLQRYRSQHGLTWASTAIRTLDLLFASLDPDEGQFFQMAAAGVPLLMPSDEDIERAQYEPPHDSRAYFRAHVLRRFGRFVTDLDWDHIRFSVQRDRFWSTTSTVSMDRPWDFDRSQTDELLGTCETVEQLVEAVHERRSPDGLLCLSHEGDRYGTRAF